jgi:uncharacterized protein YraI
MRHLLLLLTLALALAGLLLGCTLSTDSAPDSAGSGDRAARTRSVADAGIAPDARITDPASGASVPADQRVDLTVETDTTATRFQLTVNGGIASVKALPGDQSGPTSAILSWTPREQGDYSLEVVAYNNTLPGAPASILLTVAGTASGSANSATTSCTGRVLVSQLNYRDGPGTGNTKLGQFETGETATVLGRNADDTWLKVRRLNTQEVWVIDDARWFQTEGQCGDLPVVG